MQQGDEFVGNGAEFLFLPFQAREKGGDFALRIPIRMSYPT